MDAFSYESSMATPIRLLARERREERLREAGGPIYTPVGGHAIYLDAERALPNVSLKAFPGADRPELVRLALPRRTYHDEHLDHVAESARAVLDRRPFDGLEIVSEPENESLRHFSAELRPR